MISAMDTTKLAGKERPTDATSRSPGATLTTLLIHNELKVAIVELRLNCEKKSISGPNGVHRLLDCLKYDNAALVLA